MRATSVCKCDTRQVTYLSGDEYALLCLLAHPSGVTDIAVRCEMRKLYSILSFLIRYRNARNDMPKTLAAAVLL
jgi:hypothetical protein